MVCLIGLNFAVFQLVFPLVFPLVFQLVFQLESQWVFLLGIFAGS
ncbi:MAG: hypothetical protein RL240_4047 [Planctomycetota bacterium]